MRFQYLFVAFLLCCLAATPQNSGIPHLEDHGSAKQLVVDGKPFLMLAAEIHNSSSSSVEYMRSIWPRLAEIPLNTVLTPVSWELIEPAEGKFNFSLVDGLIQDARKNNVHLVFLWLASWKNGMSSYAPVWVKQDTRRFPRVIKRGGDPVEILSTLAEANMNADARAFAALMRHIREIDAQTHTVLMLQVENEVGVLGDSRDRSVAANQAFESSVPEELASYLEQHRDTLMPESREIWEAVAAKRSGTWEEIFGSGTATDEIFMAWNYARYVQHVAAAGKAEYPLPMYVNTWLAGPNDFPGKFPSGGPQPEMIDVWRAAGNAIDIYSPDIYQANFSEWCTRYHRAGNPLFIPEASGGELGAANVFYAIGQHDGMGFSPFGIDSWNDANNELGTSYQVLMQLAPIILKHQGAGEMIGVLLDKHHPSTSAQLNGYQLEIRLDEIFGSGADKGYGLIIATGPDEFLGAGSGFRVSFSPKSSGASRAGIGYIEEGTFSNGSWRAGRRLNGDENDQGRYWRFAPQDINIERAILYRFE